jgi:hypothetical protein
MANDERQRVIERLRAYRRQIDAIIDLLGDKTHLRPDEKARAQQLLRHLKAKLEEDYKAGATARGEAQMTEIERCYFQPAILRAHANLQVKWNSNPINSNWLSELYAVRMDIDQFLLPLEQQGQP